MQSVGPPSGRGGRADHPVELGPADDLREVAPALAAGCTVVIKPSGLSALQTHVFLECIDAADVPRE
jgi:Aldehyde dehydrogenase family